MLQKHFALSKEVLNHIFCFNIDVGIGGKIISINISIISEIKKKQIFKAFTNSFNNISHNIVHSVLV